MKPVCILFRHWGPYHLARLRAVAERLPVSGLEMFGQDHDLLAAETDRRETDSCLTLFPQDSCRSVCPGEIKKVLIRTLNRIQPSIVALPGWWETASRAALSWCLRNNIPAVMMSDSQASDAARSWPREAVKRRLVARCVSGLVSGTAAGDYLAELGMPRERIFTGYDVVDNDHFHRGALLARAQAPGWRDELDLPQNYFLFSGRFIAKKNLHRLLEAYASYRRQVGSAAWNLVMLGNGPLLVSVQKWIFELGLSGTVKICGVKSYSELPFYYGLAGALVHASTTEQWGLVVSEAMACGLPVIVSRQSGCSHDLVEHGKNGFVFDAFNTADLTRWLVHVASPACDRSAFGEASRAIVANWSPARFADGLQRAVATALNVRATRPWSRSSSPMNRLLLRTLLKLTS